MSSIESNGISSSITGMLHSITDAKPRPNQQFGNVTTPQGSGFAEPLRLDPIHNKPSGATTSFAEPDNDQFDNQGSDSFNDFVDWYQSASAEEQSELQQDIANEENMSPEEAKEYIEYMVKHGKISPKEWKEIKATELGEKITAVSGTAPAGYHNKPTTTSSKKPVGGGVTGGTVYTGGSSQRPAKPAGALGEGHDSEELANEVYAEFEKMYPNLARRAHEQTIHAAIMDVLNYGGDNDPGALAQDVARAVKQQMQQGVAEAEKKGLYYYVNKRKKAGISRSKNNPKAPSEQDWKNAAKTAKKESVGEEFELAGVDVAYELGRRAYKQGQSIKDNPYSATKEARKYDEWEKGLERGKWDAHEAKRLRNFKVEDSAQPTMRRVSHEKLSGNGDMVKVVTYEVLNSKGVTVKTGMSRESAASLLKHLKQQGNNMREADMMNEINPMDSVSMDVPLMIRIMEYAREDAKTDMALHDVAENLIRLSNEGRTLTMNDYDAIVGSVEQDRPVGQEGVAEGSDESYIIIRTDKEGKQDVFAKFDTYEKAQKELDACLAHPLHTKYKQKFELKRKGQQGVAEGASSIEQKIIKLYKQGLSDDEIASRLKIDSDDVKSVLDDYEWVTDTTGELKGVAEGLYKPFIKRVAEGKTVTYSVYNALGECVLDGLSRQAAELKLQDLRESK
jgi:hypothetical protein